MMRQLNRQIEAQKGKISAKKQHLKQDYTMTRERVTSPKGLSLITVGGFMIGFFLLPRKFKVLKSVLKAYTVATTVRELLNLIPRYPSRKENLKHSNKVRSKPS
jgi:hypothetical protein